MSAYIREALANPGLQSSCNIAQNQSESYMEQMPYREKGQDLKWWNMDQEFDNNLSFLRGQYYWNGFLLFV